MSFNGPPPPCPRRWGEGRGERQPRTLRLLLPLTLTLSPQRRGEGISSRLALPRLALPRRLRRGVGLDIAREDGRGRRNRRAWYQAPRRAKGLEAAPFRRLAQQIEQLPRRRRRDRRRQNRHLSHHLGRDVEDRCHALRLILALGPRLLAGKVAVGVRHNRPDGVEVVLEALPVHGLTRDAIERVGRPQDRLVGRRQRRRRRDTALAVPVDHRQRALRQVAEVVRQVRVDAVDDRLVAVAAVLAERRFAQEEVAHLVGAVALHQVERV